jgi:electron transfer flavoprotein beta subunit
MRGIRQVASIPIPNHSASDLGITPATVGENAAKVRRVDYFIPVAGKGAEMLEGSNEEIAEKVIELVRAKGGLN